MPDDSHSPALPGDASPEYRPDSSLELSEESMRALGHRAIEMMIEARAPEGPVARVLSREEARTLIDETLPEEGLPPRVALEQALERVLEQVTRVSDPRFFAFVPGPGNFVASLADGLASAFNVFAGTWLGGSAAAQVELTTLDWLLAACGLPASGGGLFTSGGSMANLTALGAARHHVLGAHHRFGSVYYSDQTHSAVERALRVLGFPPELMRRLPSDEHGRLDPAVVRKAVRTDREALITPLAIVANAGTTNTGAVDPLEALAKICSEEGLWFHIDGAYGAAAILGERGKPALRGMKLADSLVLDPHKWLFQPFECGCLLVRDAGVLPAAYAIHPEYMEDTRLDDREVNFCERGVQLSRSFRAFKLWLTFKTFGRRAIGLAIDNAFELADHAAERLATMPDWEVTSAPSLAILSFRYVPPEGGADPNELNRRLAERLREEGSAMVSTTILRGQTVLRLCPINPRTTRSHVDEVLESLGRLADSLAGPELAPEGGV